MPSVKWTGKNLADVKKLHKDVAHYPAEGKPKGFVSLRVGDTPPVPYSEVPRDWSQHPDNLHLEVDGRTLIAALGDTITKDADGNITVEPTGKERPKASGRIYGRMIDAEASDGLKGKGGAK
jgi:hypothetical protein